MPLKWSAVLVATVATTLCVTANVAVAVAHTQLPEVVNLLTVATAASAVVVAVIAERHERLTARVDQLTERLVEKLEDLDSRTGDRNTGFVEGYLLRHTPEASVVPLTPRNGQRRASIGGDD
jgi:hypothetical protein